MYSETRRLKYANTMTTVRVFDTGLESWKNIESLLKIDVRGRVICRHDLIPHLSRFFSAKFIKKNREALLILAQGAIRKPETLSEIIGDMLAQDKKFREGINILFGDCPYDMSFGDYIGIGLADELLQYMSSIRVSWTGKKEFILCESDGYLYFSVPDEASYVMTTYDSDKYEVISYGKNWKPSNR